MPHFLINKEEKKEDYIILNNDDLNNNFFHITRVLRSKKGDKLKFIDENKNIYFSEIEEITKKFLKAKILNVTKSERFLKYNINLIQSILMTDAQNLAVANASQTGAKKLYPVLSDNVSVKVNSLKDKKEKWQKIANENFKQCERADILKIEEISDLFSTLEKFKKQNIIIFAEKDENISLDNSIKSLDLTKEIAIVIGPEGGFSDLEFEKFKEKNYNLVSLGSLIYKAPNAIVAGISNVVSRLS